MHTEIVKEKENEKKIIHKDLKKLCNGRLVRFSVSVCKEDTLLYEPIIIDETNSADTLLFDVVLASCSLPLIFPTVSLTINGEVRQCIDGDMSDYPALLANENYLAVRPRLLSVIGFYNSFKTKIPLIDNLLKLVTSTVLQAYQKSWRGHCVFHDCTPNIHSPMWDNDMYNMGEKVFEANFSFEKPII